MLLLWLIYAEYSSGTENRGLFQTIHDAVVQNDADTICRALQEYNRRIHPVICQWRKDHAS